MKLKLIFFLLIGMISGTSIYSQKAFIPAKLDRIYIMTSALGGQCKDRIERAMAYENGVVSSELNLRTKVLTVNYKPSKTTPDKIRTAISEVGYSADKVPANAKAYAKLPLCCRKGDLPLQAENKIKLPNL